MEREGGVQPLLHLQKNHVWGSFGYLGPLRCLNSRLVNLIDGGSKCDVRRLGAGNDKGEGACNRRMSKVC